MITARINYRLGGPAVAKLSCAERRARWASQPTQPSLLDSIDQSRAGRLLQRGRERSILLAVGPADRGDPAQMILRLVAVALFDLPQAVILPRQHMVRIGFPRALVPDLAELVVAELAIGIADQIS